MELLTQLIIMVLYVKFVLNEAAMHTRKADEAREYLRAMLNAYDSHPQTITLISMLLRWVNEDARVTSAQCDDLNTFFSDYSRCIEASRGNSYDRSTQFLQAMQIASGINGVKVHI